MLGILATIKKMGTANKNTLMAHNITDNGKMEDKTEMDS